MTKETISMVETQLENTTLIPTMMLRLVPRKLISELPLGKVIGGIRNLRRK